VTEFERLAGQAKSGTLPPGFDRMWGLANERGWTVAHEAAKHGHLPKGLDRWGLADEYGRTVAHVAAAHGHLPEGFKLWNLTDNGGQTVEEIARKCGHLPPKETSPEPEIDLSLAGLFRKAAQAAGLFEKRGQGEEVDLELLGKAKEAWADVHATAECIKNRTKPTGNLTDRSRHFLTESMTDLTWRVLEEIYLLETDRKLAGLTARMEARIRAQEEG
jgi:hypothetical protein